MEADSKEGAVTGCIPSETLERAGGGAPGRRGGVEGVESSAAGVAAVVLRHRQLGVVQVEPREVADVLLVPTLARISPLPPVGR
jgi:hypothetical protein